MYQLQMSEIEGLKESTFCRQDFPVNLTALQERVWVTVMSVTCGEKLQDVSENLDRNGLSEKIHRVYSNEKMDDISDEYSMIYPEWGIWCHGECGELVMSERLISGKGYSLLPTPQAAEGEAYLKINQTDALGSIYRYSKNGHQKHLTHLLAYLGKSPNQIAEFYEMIMGFPKHWTELNV